LILKELRQITIIGLGLLGASLALAVRRSMGGVRVVGWGHRGQTRVKAREQGLCDEVFEDIGQSVEGADLVIIASPIGTFEEIFEKIGGYLGNGTVVTDVGSTKVLPHKWAQKLPKTAHYIGSHPIAGSEQRGLEFARDDLFEKANCILTYGRKVDAGSLELLRYFWRELGCDVYEMGPARHDRLLANVSHLPHVAAAALVNASADEDLKMAGKGFMDTSRIASGPANIWTDIVTTNPENICKGIDRLVGELNKMKAAILKKDAKRIGSLLEKARAKRSKMIEFKLNKKEILS